jgi:hypothetical protein
MQEFGLAILGRAIYDATFSEQTRPFAHALAIVHAAHGAEMVLKARVAEEHPLLIFSKLPSPNSTADVLTIAELFEHGRSYDYSELPNLVWAASGYRIPRVDQYQAFGRLRNAIAHFAVPEIELDREVLRFCFEVMEPFVDHCWKQSAIPYAEEWDESIVSDGYLQERLKDAGIHPSEASKTRLST